MTVQRLVAFDPLVCRPDSTVADALARIDKATPNLFQIVVSADGCVLGTITDGEWSGHECIGCSLVMNTAGEPALRGPYGVNASVLLSVDVTLTSQPVRSDGCV